MRGLVRTAIGAALGAWMLLPTVTSAGDAESERIKAFEERLQALEDKLEASEATVEAQRELLERQTPNVGQGSGLDDFFSNLVVGGAVTSSYAFNFDNPDTSQGTNGLYQFNTDHNSFSLDSIDLELGKPASEPGSAGFQIDLMFGENANILGASTPSNTGRFYNPIPFDTDGDGVIEPGEFVQSRAPGDTDLFVREAYVAYNYDGVLFQFGKFETIMGAEVIPSRLNANITHGLLFTWAIPLYHTGVLASGNITENVIWAAGLVNGFNDVNDFGDNKGVLGRLGFTQDNLAVTLNTFIGAEQTRTSLDTGVVVGDNNDRRQIYDLVATFKPSDTLLLWANADLGYEEFSRDIPGGVITAPDDGRWYGLALGAKLSLSDSTSVAVRGEMLRDFNASRLPFFSGNDQVDATSATVTLAQQMTENLMGRLELRHDTIDPEGPLGGSGLSSHDGGNEGQQDVGIVEVVYDFK